VIKIQINRIQQVQPILRFQIENLLKKVEILELFKKLEEVAHKKQSPEVSRTVILNFHQNLNRKISNDQGVRLNLIPNQISSQIKSRNLKER